MGKHSVIEPPQYKSSFSSWIPIIILVLCVIFCYYLYRRIESDDTSDTMYTHITKQNTTNKEVDAKLNELRTMIEKSKENVISVPDSPLKKTVNKRSPSPVESLVESLVESPARIVETTARSPERNSTKKKIADKCY